MRLGTQKGYPPTQLLAHFGLPPKLCPRIVCTESFKVTLL
jgi:hypothetical protein